MTKRDCFSPLGRGIALGALLTLASAAYAQPDILSAAANSTLTSITIKGTGLQPVTGKPTVSLGSFMLAVGSFSNVQIIAALPANLKTGSYNLEVTAGGTANFDVTLGVEGAAGPAGPAGAAGPAGPAGAQGAPGTSLSLPFNGTAAATTPAFLIQNAIGDGIVAVGGSVGLGQMAGNGSSAFGGSGDYAGAAVTGQGGSTLSGCSECVAGAGAIFEGGEGPDYGDGVDAYAGGDSAAAIYGQALLAGQSAGEFDGSVNVNGNLSKSGGSFKIDHPLDPSNKYLYHSFVESPDMKNIYDGNITTDSGGHATVTLPDWFEALNSDFRYQLTTIGQPAHAWIAAEVSNHTFAIMTDRPSVKVSWQVTGIRQDAWANAHRIPVEVEKAKADQGHYLHPELFEHAGDQSIAEKHHPTPKPRVQQ
jgi:hypothetical protein